MQILGIQNRALKNIFIWHWFIVYSSDVKRKKKNHLVPDVFVLTALSKSY